MVIRAATRQDDDATWEILEPILRAGETYTLPREMSRKDALAYWFSPRHEVFVAGTRSSSLRTRAQFWAHTIFVPISMAAAVTWLTAAT